MYFQLLSILLFTKSAPRGRFSLSRHVCLSVCLRHRMQFFFRGLSLALQSHDQFPGLSLVPLSLPPSLPIGNLETWKLSNSKTKKRKLEREKKRKKYKYWSIFVCFGIGATIRIIGEIRCLPYAVFFLDVWKIVTKICYFGKTLSA